LEPATSTDEEVTPGPEALEVFAVPGVNETAGWVVKFKGSRLGRRQHLCRAHRAWATVQETNKIVGHSWPGVGRPGAPRGALRRVVGPSLRRQKEAFEASLGPWPFDSSEPASSGSPVGRKACCAGRRAPLSGQAVEVADWPRIATAQSALLGHHRQQGAHASRGRPPFSSTFRAVVLIHAPRGGMGSRKAGECSSNSGEKGKGKLGESRAHSRITALDRAFTRACSRAPLARAKLARPRGPAQPRSGTEVVGAACADEAAGGA